MLSKVVMCGECKTEEWTYGLTKCGPRLRCSHKKNSGKPSCPNSKDIRMERLEKMVIHRAQNIFLTEETLEGALDISGKTSYAYVTEQDNRKSSLKASQNTVENEIRTLMIRARDAEEAGAEVSRSINRGLLDLERKQEELEEAISQINDDTDELRRYVSDKGKLTATLLDLKTFTEPIDPQAAKELIEGCVDRVEVFADRIEIYYRLWAHNGGPEDWPSMEIIYLEEMEGYVSLQNCLLGQSTGDPASPQVVFARCALVLGHEYRSATARSPNVCRLRFRHRQKPAVLPIPGTTLFPRRRPGDWHRCWCRCCRCLLHRRFGSCGPCTFYLVPDYSQAATLQGFVRT